MSFDKVMQHVERERGRRIAEARRALMPQPLLREREFYSNVGWFVGLLYSAPWLYFGFTSLLVLGDGALWENWPALWRMGLAGLFGWYHAHAAKHGTGLWYPLERWEQSILQRESEWRAANPEQAKMLWEQENPLSHYHYRPPPQ